MSTIIVDEHKFPMLRVNNMADLFSRAHSKNKNVSKESSAFAGKELPSYSTLEYAISGDENPLDKRTRCQRKIRPENLERPSSKRGSRETLESLNKHPLSDERHLVPSPPQYPTSAAWVKSAKQSKQNQNVQEYNPVEMSSDPLFSASTDWPPSRLLHSSSSLSKYKLLPAIGSKSAGSSMDDILVIPTENMILAEKEQTASQDMHWNLAKVLGEDGMTAVEKSDFYSANLHQHDSDNQVVLGSSTHNQLPREPDENEDRLLLAIKLPNGERCQRHFRSSETLQSIHRFAETMCHQDLSQYNIGCNIPRKIFYNLRQKIMDSGLKERTLLFLEEKKD